MQGLTKGQKQKKKHAKFTFFLPPNICAFCDKIFYYELFFSLWIKIKTKMDFWCQITKLKKLSTKRLQWEMYSFPPSPKRWQPRDITYVKCGFNNLIKRAWWPGPFLGYMYLLKQRALYKDLKRSKCLNLTLKRLNFSSLNNSLMPRMNNI